MALSTKMQMFIIEYTKDFNATQAAIRAGYSERSAGQIGEENLKKPEISEAIKARIADLTMSADEVLIRLAKQARSDLGDFATIGNAKELANHPDSVLAKKFKKKIWYDKNGEPHEEIELELYDAHAALVDIGKKHGIFSDNLTVKVEGELEKLLDTLQSSLDADTYNKVVEALASEDR